NAQSERKYRSIDAGLGEPGRGTSFFRGETARDFQLDAPLDVELELLFELPFDTIPLEQRPETEGNSTKPTPFRHDLRLAESNHLRNRARQPFPVRGLTFQRLPARPRKRIELRTPA